MSDDAKQRLVAINVGEVSIVDHPANEVDFIVKKSLEGLAGLLSTDVTTNKAAQAGDNNMSEEIAKNFAAAVNGLTEAITKAKDGKKMPPWMKDSVKKLHDTVKAMMDDEEGDDEESKAKAFDAAMGTVTKAGRTQFSKERTGKLAEAFKHLAGMYKDADKEGFTKAMDEWSAKPATPAGESAVKAADGAAPAWFDKAIEGLDKKMAKQLEDIQKDVKAASSSVEDVSKRVKAVEAIEAVSKALIPNAADKPVEKGTKSFWNGVL